MLDEITTSSCTNFARALSMAELKPRSANKGPRACRLQEKMHSQQANYSDYRRLSKLDREFHSPELDSTDGFKHVLTEKERFKSNNYS